MAGQLIRVLSDIHYGEHSSRVRSLAQLRPLFDGATELLLNGDTLDTRVGPHPEQTARSQDEVREFFSSLGIPVTFLTGNHDPNLSAQHLADLAGGKVFVTHGDILFDSIVPWGQDADLIRQRMITALAALPDAAQRRLEDRLRILRQVAGSIRQRHQAERRPLKYGLRLARDTMWPPWRALKILRAWREMPHRAAALLRQHRPGARFALIGHTHWSGVWSTRGGATIVNTGAFCRPFGALVVDISPDRLAVRQAAFQGGRYRLGKTVTEFSLGHF